MMLCLMLLLWILSWGKTLQTLQFAEPSRCPAHEWAHVEAAAFFSPVWLQLCWQFSQGQGNPQHEGLHPSSLHSWSLQLPSGNTFPPALVPRNSLLTPCFCATLHSSPSCQIPPCGPQWSAHLLLQLFVFTACLQAFQSASSLEKHPSL